MNIRDLLSPLLVLVSVLCTISAQFPVSALCSTVRCAPGNVCRVAQPCPICPPRPVCVRCVPRGTDAVCNRNRFIDTVLVGDTGFPDSLSPRTCNPFLPRDCPFDSVCVADGTGRGNCCYNRVPPGFPSTNPSPVCRPIVNRCLPFCPFGQRCVRVTICPFVPPCFEELQCRPIFGLGLSVDVGVDASLSTGSDS